MKLTPVLRYGLLILIAGFLVAGGYLLRGLHRQADTSELAAAKSAHGASQPLPHHAAHGGSHTATSAPGKAESSPAETIEFPRDMWEAAGLKVEQAQTGRMTEAIQLTGKVTLNEDRLAHVFPLVEGRVEEVKVRFGQRVKKDDLLVVVQSKEVGQGMLQLFQDRLKLEFAESKDRWTQEVSVNTQSMIRMMRKEAAIDEIEQALKDHPLGDYRQTLMTAYVAHLKAKGHLERLSPLSPTGAVPARQIMEARSEVDAARATLQSLCEQISQDTIQASRLSGQVIKELQTSIAVAETNLKILGFTDENLKDIAPAKKGEQLAHYPVMAPFDGTIISKDVVLLERVGPERQILTIADLSTVWITADIYETHLPLLAQLSDQILRVRCDAWPDREFEAKIFYTGDVVQETTRTIALRAMAANPEGLLKPSMFVTVTLPNLQTGEVLQVPLSAIQDHEGRSFVFIQTGDAAFIRRDVIQGRRNEGSVEVRTGLRTGDRVVVEGGFALKSKMLADLLAE